MNGLYLRQLPLGPMKNFVYLVGPEHGERGDGGGPGLGRRRDRARRGGGRASRSGRGGLALPRRPHQRAARAALGARPAGVRAEGGDRLLARSCADGRAMRCDRGRGRGLPSADPREAAPHARAHARLAVPATPATRWSPGDTVFVDACGRCDLRGGDPEDDVPEHQPGAESAAGETRLLPGHDYGECRRSPTLSRERSHNPYFQFRDLGRSSPPDAAANLTRRRRTSFSDRGRRPRCCSHRDRARRRRSRSASTALAAPRGARCPAHRRWSQRRGTHRPPRGSWRRRRCAAGSNGDESGNPEKTGKSTPYPMPSAPSPGGSCITRRIPSAPSAAS